MGLVNFELMRKTEKDDTVLKHGAYNLDTKYLSRIKSLSFHKKIEAADVEYFRYLSKINDIEFYAGVESVKILHWIGNYKFENLKSMMIAQWPSSSIKTLERLPTLRDLTITTEQSLFNIDCSNIESLSLRITGNNPTVLVDPSSKLRALRLSTSASINKIQLNDNVEDIEFSRIGTWLNHDVEEIDDDNQVFDLSTLSHASGLREVVIPAGLKNSSANVFPSVETVEVEQVSDYMIIQRAFPNLKTLQTLFPHPSNMADLTALLEFLKDSPRLENLIFDGCNDKNEKSIEDIVRNFPKLEVVSHYDDELFF